MPTPNKRRRSSSRGDSPPPARRSSSPSSKSAAPNRPPTASPSNTILPAPIPSSHAHPPALFPPFAGPSNWASTKPPGSSDSSSVGGASGDVGPGGAAGQSGQWSSVRTGSARDRRSMDARSPTPYSDKLGDIDEGSEGQVLFIRDTSGRAPRSMMACTRCRRQKMKCDGPTQVPCRGCRQANVQCVFEARSRPKSVSALPPRASPLYSGTLQGSLGGRPTTPSGRTGGFYPGVSQPAPPITSRPPPEYAIRQAREPMPPPPAASISALTSAPYPPPRATMASPPPPPPILIAQQPPPAIGYNPPPLHIPPQPNAPGSSSGQEARIRSLENTVQSLASVPAVLASIQASISQVQRDVFNTSRQTITRPRQTQVELSEAVLENYRTRAWPLTPWLVGLRESQGLPSLVINLLGRRTTVERGDEYRRIGDDALDNVRGELARLLSNQVDWTREEVRALGVFATWLNDTSLASLTVGLARNLGHDRLITRRSHDEWREWIYIVIFDHLFQLPLYHAPTVTSSLASQWRERLSSSALGDPSVRDRDLKLLAWLEYAEMLREVYQAQQQARLSFTSPSEGDDEVMSMSGRDDRSDRGEARVRRGSMSTLSAGPGPEHDSPTGPVPSDRRRIMEVWRRYTTRWEAWSGGWAARSDPILSLHFNYAVLYTASPVFFSSATIWSELSQSHEGYAQLERARDAAFALIQAICSPEISRTLVYSFALYRPLLGLALQTIFCLLAGLASSPLISYAHVNSVLRSTYDAIVAARPLDLHPPGASPISGTLPTPTSAGTSISSGVPARSMLADVVEGGVSAVAAGRGLVGVSPGTEVWKRILG